MGKLKYSRRIDITIETHLLKKLDTQVARYANSRSGLIRLALVEWLEAHPEPHKEVSEFDYEKPFKDYIKPGMNAEELVNLLEAYEKASPYRL